MNAKYRTGEMPPRRDDFKDVAPSPYCPHFIEKLLLAIIDAHYQEPRRWKGAKTDEQARQLRLSLAMKALLGVTRRSGPKAHYDLPQLMAVARRRLGDEYDREMQEQLVRLDGPLTEVEVLQHSISLTRAGSPSKEEQRKEYVRLRGKYRKAEFRDYAMDVLGLSWDEHYEELAMIEDLQTVAALLNLWCVRIEIEPEHLGMMSLTNAIDAG